MVVQQVWVYKFLRLDGGEPSESWDDTAARHSRNVNTLSMDGWDLHYIAWPWMVFRKRGLKKGQEEVADRISRDQMHQNGTIDSQ